MNWRDWLFPRNARCAGCDSVRLAKDGPPFCPQCRTQLEKCEPPKPFCGWCGYPVTGKECRFCKEGYARHIQWIGAPFLYRGPVRRALPRLKYGAWGQSLPFWGERMAQLWRRNGYPDPDAVTFVPMLAQRERHRGGNQAQKLAQALCGQMGWELSPLLQRVRQSRSQVGLSGAQRRQNLKGCFTAGEDLRGKCVLLIDDVVSTGATVAECARTLVKAGAAEVWVMAAALNLRRKGS